MNQPARREGPTLDRLAILDDRGSRQMIHPADVEVGGGRGVRLQWRRRVFMALIGVFLVVPWIERDGASLIRLDIPRRSFHILGFVFNAQDGPLLFFLFSAMGFGLIAASAVIGRLWCGWTCPQTVLLEGIFRRIERIIDGPANDRAALDRAPWSARKLFKRSLKFSLWSVAALVLSHTFLAYFTGAHELTRYIVEGPIHHPMLAGIAAFGTALLLFDMVWFREQMCLIVCPYGRLQSVLADEDTYAIGYDKARGEPRGKANDPSAGACVDCRRCVVVCPTGIDIRNGLQLDCIGCGQCADACDDVMVKLHRPKGLVRTDSMRGLRGEKRRFLRPRLIGYGVAGFIGALVAGFVVSGRGDVEANVVRMPGPPFVVDSDGKVTNALMIHIVNRSSSAADVTLEAELPPGVTAMMTPTLTLGPEEQRSVPLVVSAPRGTRIDGTVVEIELRAGDREKELKAPLMGPSP